MHLVITGGAGFLGRHVVARALAAGDRVTVFTRDPHAARTELQRRGVSGAGLCCVDYRPTAGAEIGRLLRDDRPEVVVHAAASIRGAPSALHEANVGGTRELLKGLAVVGPRPRLVFVSSFAVEDTPPTAYSDSKLAAEKLVRQSPAPWVIVRPTLIYGPHDEGNTLPLAAKLAAGRHWLPDGGRTRIQPVHVEDAAAAILAAARVPAAVGGTYRLGGPEPVSVHDFRSAVREASGGRARFARLPLRALALAAPLLALAGRPGAAQVVAFHRADHAVDSSAARRDLGFSPRPLDQGLAGCF